MSAKTKTATMSNQHLALCCPCRDSEFEIIYILERVQRWRVHLMKDRSRGACCEKVLHVLHEFGCCALCAAQFAAVILNVVSEQPFSQANFGEILSAEYGRHYEIKSEPYSFVSYLVFDWRGDENPWVHRNWPPDDNECNKIGKDVERLLGGNVFHWPQNWYLVSLGRGSRDG